MALPSAFGPELNEVVVSFAEWNQACQLEVFATFTEMFGVQSYALHQKVHPLISGELLPLLEVQLHLEVG